MNKHRPPLSITTQKGLEITIRPQALGTRKVKYFVFVGDEHIGEMYTGGIIRGWGQVTGAEVSEKYARQGVATTVYDIIEKDIRDSGGKGVEPHWGSMSEDAIAFWKARRPDVDIDSLNAQFLRPPGSGFEK